MAMSRSKQEAKPVNRRQILAFQRRLEKLRDNLSGKIRRPELIAERQTELADQAAATEGRNLATSLVENNHKRLQYIKVALQAMRNRTYGICSGCKKPITVTRLNAVPWALCCVSCQENQSEQETFGEDIAAFA